MVMPHHTDSLYTLGRKPAPIGDDAVSGLLSPNYELHTTLTWVAGFTERVKLGTAVAVLPIRNAVANARQVATLDVYSGGRVLYGVGAGWLREEAEAMNMPWDRRGRRTEEHIALDARALVRRRRPRRVPRRVPRLPADGPGAPPGAAAHPDPDRRSLRRRARPRGSHRRRVDRGDDVAAAPRRALGEGARAAERNGRDPDALLLVASMPPSRARSWSTRSASAPTSASTT